MPIDPEISLHAAAPPPANGLSIDTIGKFAEVQNTLNQNRLFQQTFAARQRAGQIMAGAPDTETGLEAIQHDPLASAFAPELVNLARENQLALIRYQGEVQTQATNGLDAVIKSLPAVMADPSQWGAIVSARLATLSPAARKQDAPAIESLRRGLTDDLPSDPDNAKKLFNQRLSGLMLGVGVTPETINGILGTPIILDLIGQKIPGLHLPSQLGGGFKPASGGLQVTLPPQLTDIPNQEGRFTRAIVRDTGAGPVQPLGSTPNTIQAGELGASAAAAQDITKEASNLTSVLPVRIKALDAIEDAMKLTQLGGGTPTRERLARAMQALHNIGITSITEADIDKAAGGSLADVQKFNNQIKPLLTNMLTHDAAGQGKVMLPEVEAYMHLLDTAQDPRSIVSALNLIRRGYRIAYDKAQKWPEYRDSGKNPADFNTYYISHLLKEKELPEKAGELRLTPLDPTEVKGGGKPGRKSLDEIFGKKIGK